MSINEDFRVGAVIPNHNYGRWVSGAIQSIVNDPYPNKAIIVIDDGSTDNSWAVICKTLNLADTKEETIIPGNIGDIPTFGFRYAQAGGPARARNIGIKVLWDYVQAFQFLDADDEIRSGKIGLGVQKLIDNPAVGAVYSDYDTFNESTGVYFREYKEPFNRARLVQECIVNNNTLVNKKVFETVDLYDESMRTCEDFDLWMRVSEKFLISHIPEALMFLRVGGHSSSATVPKEVWVKNWQLVMQKAQIRATNGQK